MTRFSHRGILTFLIIIPVLLFIELAIGIAVFGGIRQINDDQAHASRMESYIRSNTRLVSVAESAQRGYLLTSDARYRDSFDVYQAAAVQTSMYYDTLPVQDKGPAILSILTISRHKFSEMARTIAFYDAGFKDSAMALVSSGVGRMMMDSIRRASTPLRTDITKQLAIEQAHEDRLFIYFFGLIAVLILLSIMIVYYTYMKFASYTERLETLVYSLEEANGRMSTYTNMSYHELKTPLRNIHGFAQLLKVRHIDGGSDSEQQEFIKHITDGVRQMNRTIDNMREKYLQERKAS